MSGWSSQLSPQLAIAIDLARSLKSSSQFTGSLNTPASKVALIGHSFGSAISHGVAAYAPECIDAVVLTGYGLNLSAVNFPLVIEAWNWRVANSLTQAFTGKDLQGDGGYISWVDLWANINT